MKLTHAIGRRPGFVFLKLTRAIIFLIVLLTTTTLYAEGKNGPVGVSPSGFRTDYTIFQPADVPVNLNANDGQAVEVGTRFRTTQPGKITAIRYYKGSAFTGTRTGHLWTAAGVQLAEIVFTGETTSGWQEAVLASPVVIQSNTTYIVSYFSSSGHYCFTSDLYTGSGITNGPISALADGVDGANGLYDYSATPVFPTSSYQGSGYYVDVVFVPGVSDGLFYGNPNYVPRFESPASIVSGSIYDDGARVGIGTTDINDNNYQLFVETGVRTRKVKVDQANWPDYVFQENYPLLPIDSLKSFIELNHHLPSITPAPVVEKEGLDLGQSQANLLQKVEEMTLYIIQLHEEMTRLKKEIDLLKQASKLKPLQNK